LTFLLKNLLTSGGGSVMGLEQIYTEVIMEHSKNTDNRRKLEQFSHHEHGHNPSCGDDLELEVNIVNNRIEDAGFYGSGCAISMASASMMIDLIKGVSVSEALFKVETFLKLIKSEVEEGQVLDILEDATMLSNIRLMPARVKCAVLAWHTLHEIIKDS
jgi:nitrogen fixation protein NifU and related proteins